MTLKYNSVHNYSMVKIISVAKNSPADSVGIKTGEYIEAFDGFKYRDVLDFLYYDNATDFSITLKTDSSESRIVNISKETDTPMGIEIENQEFDIMPCGNKCVFCFVDQCPKGMRETLYVKDDDYRLSFISGNYITLSNITEQEIERIIRLKLSPLYISVHCFDKQLKKKICANPRSADVFDIIDRLAASGIIMHTQIVMMEGLNDGEALMETVKELYARYPYVKSLAVVPVGLTKCRDNLYPLQPISRECAIATVKAIEKFNESVIRNNQEGFVWCSDELYLQAKLNIPEYSYYGSMPQIENGVGLVAEFFYELKDELCYTPELEGEYSLITGKSFEPILTNIAIALEEVYGVKLDVFGVINKFFGETVTVAGLVTGGDIINQLKDKIRYKQVIIPQNMLKEFETVFLDGLSIKDIEEALNCKMHLSRGGDDLIKILSKK